MIQQIEPSAMTPGAKLLHTTVFSVAFYTIIAISSFLFDWGIISTLFLMGVTLIIYIYRISSIVAALIIEKSDLLLIYVDNQEKATAAIRDMVGRRS